MNESHRFKYIPNLLPNEILFEIYSHLREEMIPKDIFMNIYFQKKWKRRHKQSSSPYGSIYDDQIVNYISKI